MILACFAQAYGPQVRLAEVKELASRKVQEAAEAKRIAEQSWEEYINERDWLDWINVSGRRGIGIRIPLSVSFRQLARFINIHHTLQKIIN